MDHIQRKVGRTQIKMYGEQNPNFTRGNRTDSLMAFGGAAALGVLGWTGGVIVGHWAGIGDEKHENKERLEKLHSFLLQQGYREKNKDDYINKAKEIWALTSDLEQPSELMDSRPFSREHNIEPLDTLPTTLGSRNDESMPSDA